jgi:long-subunit acyl-CoA synthetase (AMP-forming)
VVSGNRPEWLVVDLAAGELGAVVVGLDPDGDVTPPPDAAVIVAEDEEQLDKLGAVPVPVVVIDAPSPLPPGVVTYAELVSSPATPADLDAPTEGPNPGDELVSLIALTDPDERALLSAAVRRGATVSFGDGLAPVLSELHEVQPTVFRAPPAVWQAFMDGIERRAGDATPLKRAAYRRRVLVRRKVRQALGLGRVRRAESTGPLPDATIAWFADFGVEVSVA